MIRSQCLLVGAVCLGVAVSAFSQDQRPVNRRGPFGQIQPGFLFVLAEPDVRSDLKLSDDQERRIGEILNRRPPIKTFPNTQGLNDEEKRKLFQAMTEERTKAMLLDEEAAKVILTDAQRARVDQIVTQIWGVLVVVRPDIAEPLGITAEQKKKLQEINRSGPPSPSIVDVRKMTAEERQKTLGDWVAARNKLEVEMLAVLSDEQKSKFAKIRGEPFAFPATQIGANVSELLKVSR